MDTTLIIKQTKKNIINKNNIEQNLIINNNKYTNKIIYWHRYVDDILLFFNVNTRQVENFHKYINTIHHKLKFTLEIEKNYSINFLELTINKSNNTHTIKYTENQPQPTWLYTTCLLYTSRCV